MSAARRPTARARQTIPLTAEATANHEAAHAVVAHLMGARVLKLWLVDDSRGYSQSEWRVRYGHVDYVARAVCTMAGHEAEVLLNGRQKAWLPAGDYWLMRREGASERSVDMAGHLAARVVRANRRTIQRVAKALLASPTRSLDRRAFLRALRA